MNIAQLGRRIRYWTHKMYLHGWEISAEIVEHPFGKLDAVASIRPDHQYDHASIEFSREELAAASNAQIDVYIVHELLHLMMRDLDGAIEDTNCFFSEREWVLFKDRIDHEEEGLVMRLAEIIVKLNSD